MTEAEDLFRELRGGDEPIVVGGYQYPLLVIPIAMNRGDAIAWQVPGYATERHRSDSRCTCAPRCRTSICR